MHLRPALIALAASALGVDAGPQLVELDLASSTATSSQALSFPQGTATWNNYGGNTGSCGQPIPDGEMATAISAGLMTDAHIYCGRKLRVTNLGTSDDSTVRGMGQGNTVDVVVADTCPGCDAGHVDLTLAAWNQLTDNAPGSKIGVSWELID